jgi:chaperonin GroES
MNLTPVGIKYIVRRDSVKKATSAGIIIPEGATEKPLTGTIESVGSGEFVNGQLVDCRLSAGQRVLFGRYSGTELPDPDLLIMGEAEILATIRE